MSSLPTGTTGCLHARHTRAHFRRDRKHVWRTNQRDAPYQYTTPSSNTSSDPHYPQPFCTKSAADIRTVSIISTNCAQPEHACTRTVWFSADIRCISCPDVWPRRSCSCTACTDTGRIWYGNTSGNRGAFTRIWLRWPRSTTSSTGILVQF